jgi:hypothetical protein
MRGWRSQLAAASVLLSLSACFLPVNPLVRFSAYQVPYLRQDEFERPLNQWKAGRPVQWTIRYRATAHSDSELVIPSEGPAIYGSQMTGSGGRGGTFTPTRAELVKLIDTILETKIFDLFDGHYGAYNQGGGLQGPEMRFEISGMLKHVSFDTDLPTSLSWEADALMRTSRAIAAVGLRYINRPQPSPSPNAR